LNDKTDTTRSKNSEAMQAIDDYLDVLLDTDDQMACEENHKKTVPLSGSKLYHIDSHPRHKHKVQSDTRHNMERVERLLDDFNNRQVEADKQVLIQPSLLQPQIHVEEPDEIIVTEEVQVSEHQDLEINHHEEQVVKREDWSNEQFQTLIFDVAGLTLAVPLVKLGGIYKIEKEPTALIGKPDWFIGLMPGHEGNISVIDTARWVMPEKYQQAEDTGLDYQFIILLDNSNWGLACTTVQNAITIAPENVRWRATSGKRPWLDGMLIDEMCALLDVDTLIRLLDENFPR